MAVHKRTSNSGTVFYEVRWFEGHDRKSKSFVRKVDADHFERDRLVTESQKEMHPGWNQTLREAGNALVSKQERDNLSLSWKIRTEQILRSQLYPTFGEDRLRDINPTRLESWMTRNLQEGQTRQMVNNALKILKYVLNNEVKMGRIAYNPIAQFSALRLSPREFLVWSQEDVRGFLSLMRERYSVHRPWVYRAYLVALNTGLRAGELWGLRWSDIQWDDRLIKIEQSCNMLTRELQIGTKSRKMRYVPLTDAALETLKAQRLDSGENALVFPCGDRPVGHDNFRRDHWEKDIRIAKKVLGLRLLRFHDLRHTAATLMLRSGLQAPEVQQILGHANITTTMRYVHLMGNQSARKAVSLFSLGDENAPDFPKNPSGAEVHCRKSAEISESVPRLRLLAGGILQ